MQQTSEETKLGGDKLRKLQKFEKHYQNLKSNKPNLICPMFFASKVCILTRIWRLSLSTFVVLGLHFSDICPSDVCGCSVLSGSQQQQFPVLIVSREIWILKSGSGSLQSVCVCGKLCDGVEQKPKKLGELLSHYYDKGFSSVFLKREKHLKTFRWKEVWRKFFMEEPG